MMTWMRRACRKESSFHLLMLVHWENISVAARTKSYNSEMDSRTVARKPSQSRCTLSQKSFRLARTPEICMCIKAMKFSAAPFFLVFVQREDAGMGGGRQTAVVHHHRARFQDLENDLGVATWPRKKSAHTTAAHWNLHLCRLDSQSTSLVSAKCGMLINKMG